jgi:hypothetical protein
VKDYVSIYFQHYQQGKRPIEAVKIWSFPSVIKELLYCNYICVCVCVCVCVCNSVKTMFNKLRQRTTAVLVYLLFCGACCLARIYQMKDWWEKAHCWSNLEIHPIK